MSFSKVEEFNRYYEDNFIVAEEKINSVKNTVIFKNEKYFKAYELLGRKKQLINKKTIEMKSELDKWRNDKTSAKKIFSFDIDSEEKKKIVNRAKWMKIAIDVCTIAAIVLFSFPFALAYLFSACVMGAGDTGPAQAAFLLPICVKVGIITIPLGVVFAVTGLFMRKFCDETIRTARVISDVDFNKFIHNHVINSEKGNEFYPDKRAIMDEKLYKIYKNFKFDLLQICSSYELPEFKE